MLEEEKEVVEEMSCHSIVAVDKLVNGQALAPYCSLVVQ